MTNEEYYTTEHLGYWKIFNRHLQPKTCCCGGDISGTGCFREIEPGEPILKTGLFDNDGSALYLCQECAQKEAK